MRNRSRATSLLLLASLFIACERPPRWNVVVVTFDTTRADHLACYGHGGVATPTLDALAAEGVLFEQAAAPVPITLPSHSSLMTGKVPFAHGVRDNGLFVLGDEQTTLAEILKGEGYRTAAAIGAYPLTGPFGIGQGFELYDDRVGGRYEDLYGERVFPKERLFFDERKAARVNEAILPWLEEHHGEPFFLWVHYFDPHHPHEPPPPYNQRYAHDLYLGEIAYADESLGTLLGHLKRLGVDDRTLVVMTSDHGEGRGEHEESTHSMLLYESTLHVPLIVRFPPGTRGVTPASRVRERVGTVDVLPTVLDYLGIPSPDRLQGQSLRSLIEGGGGAKRRGIYAETLSPRLTRNWGELRSLSFEGYKYVHGPRPELYELEADPDELTDLAAEHPEVAAGLRERLARYLREHAVEGLDSSVAIDEETARRLAALGYLQSAGEAVGPIDEVLREDGDPPQDHAATLTAYSQAKNLLFQDRPLEARDFIVGLLRTDPGNTHYLELLANVELKLGHSDKALEILEKVAASPLGTPPEKTLDMIADILLSRGDLEAAYDKYRESQAFVETAPGQYRLAKIHEMRGQAADELRFLDKALELDPKFVPARLDRAIRYAERGELDAAEEEFDRVLKDNPYHARGFYNFGTFLLQTERPEEAVVFFERAAELKPDYVKAHYAMIEILFDLGEIKEARERFETLSRLAPQSREATLAKSLLENVS